jgi:phosphate transport system protein
MTERRIQDLKRRVVREGALATGMLEAAIDAMRTLNVDAARRVRRADDQVDQEEVAIELACHELLALHHPYGHDFRTLTFCLRANADMERVADHASSIAKVVTRIADALPRGETPRWPTALVELWDRVPQICHNLLRAVVDEDAPLAEELVRSDETIDQLDRRLFEEVQDMVRAAGRDDAALAVGMLTYRAGRELERVGDLMAGMAEYVVYLSAGQIIRHQKKKPRTQPPLPPPPPSSLPST